MKVMFTIVGTPPWANGGQAPNVAPTDPEDLRTFSQALAERYPTVRHYSIWNEPNIELFLSPQFDESGASVSPRTYATMYRAAYEGIKAANPDALDCDRRDLVAREGQALACERHPGSPLARPLRGASLRRPTRISSSTRGRITRTRCGPARLRTGSRNGRT